MCSYFYCVVQCCVQVDIFNPLVSLYWSKCSNLPVRMRNAQAVCLKDKVYVGVFLEAVNMKDKGLLYIYTPLVDKWSTMETPVLYFALVTYQSHLVLVGGVDPHRLGPESHSNKLITLVGRGQWKETIPPMSVRRHSASAMDYVNNIVVAGGLYNVRSIAVVEVYNGYQWTRAHSLPQACSQMKSVVIDDVWYLMGGDRQGTTVFCASLVALVASNHLHVWTTFTDAPYMHCSPAVFGNQLIAVGGFPHSSLIHAYSQHIQS